MRLSCILYCVQVLQLIWTTPWILVGGRCGGRRRVPGDERAGNATVSGGVHDRIEVTAQDAPSAPRRGPWGRGWAEPL
eukprot:1732443-Prymnesium_polylepis.2